MQDEDRKEQNDKDLDEALAKQAEDWLSDHHHLTLDELDKLANENSFIALEKLRELADMYNVSYDDTTAPKELVNKISIAMEHGAGPDED